MIARRSLISESNAASSPKVRVYFIISASTLNSALLFSSIWQFHATEDAISDTPAKA